MFNSTHHHRQSAHITTRYFATVVASGRARIVRKEMLRLAKSAIRALVKPTQIVGR